MASGHFGSSKLSLHPLVNGLSKYLDVQVTCNCISHRLQNLHNIPRELYLISYLSEENASFAVLLCTMYRGTQYAVDGTT